MPKCIAHALEYNELVGCLECEDEAVRAAEDVDDDSYTEYAWAGSDY